MSATSNSVFKRMGLRAKITVPVITLVALSIIALTVVTSVKVRNEAEKEAISKSDEIAHRYSNEIQIEVERALGVARTFAHALEGVRKAGPGDREQTNRMLREVLEKNPRFLGVWTGWEPGAFDGKDAQFVKQPGHDATGRFVPYWNRGGGTIAVEPLVDYDKPGPGDYYQIAKKSGEETLLDPYVYSVGGKDVLMTSVAVPILIEGKFVGVAGIDISLTTLQELSSSIRPYGQGSASILTGSGNFVAENDSAVLGKSYQTVFGENRSLADAIAAGKTFEMRRQDPKLGAEVLDIFVPVRFGNVKSAWSFHVSVPLAAVLKTANVLMWFQLVGCAVALVLIGGIIYMISSAISRPIYHSRDQMQKSVDLIGKSSNELGNLSQKVASASTQQAAAIQETVTALNEINAMVQRSLESASQSSEATKQSQEIATQGRDSVNTMIQAIREISESNDEMMKQVEDSNHRLGDIEKLISEIGDKTKVINDIVFQTKLLSFNASVEAARAGENGKGFAVVAEEVGNLANMSGNAAREISALLASSTERVNRIVTENKSRASTIASLSREKVDNGTRVAQECGSSLEKIVGMVESVNSLVREISTAAQEQARGVDEITKAMEQIDEATHSTAEMSRETAEYASSLLDESNGLRKVVDVLDREVLGETGHENDSAPVSQIRGRDPVPLKRAG